VRATRVQHGATLAELVVVLALLGIAAGVVGLAAARPPRPSAVSGESARITDARHEAVRSGRTVTVVLNVEGRQVSVTALPDGSVIAESPLAVDLFTGEVRHDSL